ncbi:hypothetical protein AV530_020147 [Patagioenas fasciata monilis]|uniref:Uncharacterized protein n=1 Tax=Patagioenas fasciata monilis TaxID=372326 RepID=A0A1V4KZN9_PATFA|nr:hypothetical protein AV530_020147 [Patagioenas fasciata monilis]
MPSPPRTPVKVVPQIRIELEPEDNVFFWRSKGTETTLYLRRQRAPLSAAAGALAPSRADQDSSLPSLPLLFRFPAGGRGVKDVMQDLQEMSEELASP